MNVTRPDAQITYPKCGVQNSSAMKFYGSRGNKLVTTIICPHCGEEIPDEMKPCGKCGKPLSVSKRPPCGFEGKPGMKFCGDCGEKL